jgi:hypothetical protein
VVQDGGHDFKRILTGITIAATTLRAATFEEGGFLYEYEPDVRPAPAPAPD